MTLSATASTKTASAPNGRRPTLSDSIDRLDRILDGLSEAIPATVRDALREEVAAAVAEGVRAALVEVLNGEAVQSLLRGALSAAPTLAPTPAPKPSLGARLLMKARSALATVRAWVGGALQRVAGALATVGREIRDGGKAAFGWLGFDGRWLRLLPVLALVGGAATALTVSASAWWTSLRSGMAAVGTGGATLARWLFQRLIRPFGAPAT
jgi:hypothetical protein